MNKKFKKTMVTFLITGLFATSWAVFMEDGPFATAYKSIKKYKETSGRGWSVSTSAKGKTYVIGVPAGFSKKTAGINSGVCYLEEKGKNGRLVLMGEGMINSMAGTSVAISPDGSVVAVGGPGMKSTSNGYFSLFARQGSSWKVPAKGVDMLSETLGFAGEKGWNLGAKVDLSNKGKTVVMSAPGFKGYGRVQYLVAPSGGWAKVKDPNDIVMGVLGLGKPKKGDEFGSSLAISEDDSTIVVGAPGIDGNTGAVYLFTKPKNGWINTKSLYRLPIEGLKKGDRFGESVAVSKDGSVIIVGTPGKTGKSTGKIYVFTLSKNSISTTTLGSAYETINMGISLAISGDGKTIAAGEYGKDKNGGVVLYRLKSGKWEKGVIIALNHLQYPEIDEQKKGAMVGFSVDLTENGSHVLFGVPLFDHGEGDYDWFKL
ncbi:MAG: FG-GAP repeat protein [Leptospirales bacterium]